MSNPSRIPKVAQEKSQSSIKPSPSPPASNRIAFQSSLAIQGEAMAVAPRFSTSNTEELSGLSDTEGEDVDLTSCLNLTIHDGDEMASVQIAKYDTTVNKINTVSSSKDILKDLSPQGRLEISPTQPLCHPRLSESGFYTLPAPTPGLPKISPKNPESSTCTAQSCLVGIPEYNGYNLNPKDCAKNLRRPLGFHIPEPQMRQIQKARKKRKIFWQYSLYQGPNGEKVKIHYCKTKEKTEDIAQLFLDQDVIGFDIEWKPSASFKMGTRKNVSLIQLACEDRVALFHISRYPKGDNLEDLVAPSLQKIMESPNITKVGVSIKADCTRLRQFMGIESRGLFELSHLYKLVKFFPDKAKKINKTLVSLAQQVEEHLHLPLYKPGEVRNSDWSKDLKYEQIRCTRFPS